MNINLFNTHKKKIIFIFLGVLVFILLYALKNTGYTLRLSTFIFAVILFYAVDLWLELSFAMRHYAIFILVALSGIIFSPLYFISPNYDKILHLIDPVFLSTLIFFLLNKIKIKFSAKILLTFAVMVAVLSVFEMGEYVLDQLFDFRLQGVYLREMSGVAKLNIIMDKNDDTMIDMLFGTAGASIFVFIRTIIFYERKWNKKIKDYL